MATEPGSSGSFPDHNRYKSEPTITTIIKEKPDIQRRKSTLPYADQYPLPWPCIVWNLCKDQPRHAHIGICPINELIKKAIEEADKNHNDELKQKLESLLTQTYTRNLIISICHALIGSFLSGYNTALLNLPAVLIQTQCNLTIEVFSSLQSFYCVGGLIGALCAGYIADQFGRSVTLIVSNILFLISGIISILYALDEFGPINDPLISFIYFEASRVLSGLASGISTAIAPTYLGEISPPSLRGQIGTLNAFVNAFGILFAVFLGYEYLLGNAVSWKYLFVVNIIPTCMQLMMVYSLRESPQWALIKNDKKKAKEIFQWLRMTKNVDVDMHAMDEPDEKNDTALTETNEIQQESMNKQTSKTPKSSLISVEEDNPNYGSTDNEQENRSHSRKKLIYIFFIVIALQILQQFSGINSVWYYSSMMLKNAGLTSSLQLWIGNILIACSNFFGVLIPVYLIEKLGRKKLIYLSCGGMIIASILLSLVLIFSDEMQSSAGYLSIIFLIMYVISFAMGLGPIVGLLSVELSPSAKRGTIVSIAFFINYMANLFVAQYANVVVQYAYYLPFAIICLFGIVFTYSSLPETKGKNENDIQNAISKIVTKSAE